jgi:hypothetical protein
MSERELTPALRCYGDDLGAEWRIRQNDIMLCQAMTSCLFKRV